MSDDKTYRGPADQIRINVNQSYEKSDWSKKFGVTPDELVDAVKHVGPMAKDVENYLRKKSK